jgi:hypothetical protein
MQFILEVEALRWQCQDFETGLPAQRETGAMETARDIVVPKQLVSCFESRTNQPARAAGGERQEVTRSHDTDKYWLNCAFDR